MHPLLGVMMLNLAPVWDSVNAGVLLLLSGLAVIISGYLIYGLHKYAAFLTAAQQEKLAGIIHDGLNRAIDYAMTVVTEQEKKVAPQAGSMVTRIAAQYAINHFGSTLEKMGKSPADVAQMILARIPPPPVTADLSGAKAPLSVVSTEPLPPAA